MKTCRECMLVKPESEFTKWNHAVCRACRAAYCRRWHAEHPTYGRDWRTKNREKTLEYYSKYRASGKYKEKWLRDIAVRGRDRLREQSRLSRERVREKVFGHYSYGTFRCACCGEVERKFLSIDHISGGGGRHRHALGRIGVEFYRWLIKQGLPDGYRVLCHNCNQAMGNFGSCPHEANRYDPIWAEA